MIKKLSALWCRHFHAGIYWPIRGQYRCAVCLRTYHVPWEEPAQKRESAAARPALIAQQHLAR